jgi:hypothetical protein
MSVVDDGVVSTSVELALDFDTARQHRNICLCSCL